MTTRRFFTVEEADAVLPEVRVELELLRECLAFLRRASATAGHGLEEQGADGPSPVYGWALGRLEASQRRLGALGVEVRDVDRGLVDFPAQVGEKVVMLCWLEGEDRVGWFHDPDSGYSGRRPLVELGG